MTIHSARTRARRRGDWQPSRYMLDILYALRDEPRAMLYYWRGWHLISSKTGPRGESCSLQAEPLRKHGFIIRVSELTHSNTSWNGNDYWTISLAARDYLAKLDMESAEGVE